MPWIAITLDTLNEAKIAALIDACSTAALADEQEDRAPGIIQGVVNEVRNSVARCQKNRVDSDTTKIPQSLRDLTVDLIIAKLKKAIDQPLSDDEARDVSWRRQQLRDIEKCMGPAIDTPGNPIEPEVENNPPPGQYGGQPRVKMRTEVDE